MHGAAPCACSLGSGCLVESRPGSEARAEQPANSLTLDLLVRRSPPSRQDAMQRTALLPIADFVREAEAVGRSPAELRLLEVAAGTGRFHTFIKASGVRATAAGLLRCRPVLLL